MVTLPRHTNKNLVKIEKNLLSSVGNSRVRFSVANIIEVSMAVAMGVLRWLPNEPNPQPSNTTQHSASTTFCNVSSCTSAVNFVAQYTAPGRTQGVLGQVAFNQNPEQAKWASRPNLTKLAAWLYVEQKRLSQCDWPIPYDNDTCKPLAVAVGLTSSS